MKKFIRKLIFSFLSLLIIFILNSNLTKLTPLADIDSKGIVIMEPDSGQILFSRNPHTKYPPASITKVMTAIVILENCNLKDLVTIGKTPPLADGASLDILEGEVYSVEELLIGMLLKSANDCAEALAEFMSGSVEKFATIMTNRAKELGALNTTFKNPSGLHHKEHLSTAYDFSLFMKHALTLDEFVRISRIESYNFKNQPYPDGSEKYATNLNNCLSKDFPTFYEHLYSGKTGWTPEANHTYVAAAKKGDKTIIGSFINSVDKDGLFYGVSDAFNWAFDNFKKVKLISKDQEVEKAYSKSKDYISLKANKDIYYLENINNPLSKDNVKLEYDDNLLDSLDNNSDISIDAKILIDGNELDNFKMESFTNTSTYSVEKIVYSDSKSNNTLFKVIIFLVILLFLRSIYITRRRNIRRRNRIRNMRLREARRKANSKKVAPRKISSREVVSKKRKIHR